MAQRSGRRRRPALWTCLVVVAAIGPGLVDPASDADASCAGPQLDLRQAGEQVTPHRIGKGGQQKVIYPVDRSARLVIAGSNLTFDCVDSVGSGCMGPSGPPKTIRPIRDATLTLRQGHRQWRLAELDTIGPDLTADVTVDLPAAARPGTATLALEDPHQHSGAQLDLELV